MLKSDGFASVALERGEVLGAVMPDAHRGEMEAETGGAIDCLVGARAHPDRKILLHGRRHDLNAVQMVVLALVAELVSAQKPAEDVQTLFHAAGALVVANAAGVELVGNVPLANAEIEAAVR